MNSIEPVYCEEFSLIAFYRTKRLVTLKELLGVTLQDSLVHFRQSEEQPASIVSDVPSLWHFRNT